MKPLAIDLFCGLGGWTEGLLAEGYDVIGFDIERHVYGDHAYPAQLCLYDVLSIHGSMFRDADLIVASPPCQAYSYRAMPWKRAKALPPPDNSLFESCFRIQREASEAKGRKIPMVVENVRGAQPWVGRAPWHYGSFYLWGDVPALMPMTKGIKNNGGSCFNIGSPGQKETNRNPVHELAGCKIGTADTRALDANPAEHGGKGFVPEGTKALGKHGHPRILPQIVNKTGSGSKARKHASAMIAKIPLPLSRHIAKVYHP